MRHGPGLLKLLVSHIVATAVIWGLVYALWRFGPLEWPKFGKLGIPPLPPGVDELLSALFLLALAADTAARGALPLWAAAAVWAMYLVPLVGTYMALSRVLRRFTDPRIPPGCCPACGYDLRATPGRCPECGTAAAA